MRYKTAFLLTVLPACCAEIVDLRAPHKSNVQSSFEPTTATRKSPHPDALADSELLDIVLVASVDGKFHALNRTTGHTLWSMSSSGTSPPSTLAPLVSTSHIDHDPANDGADAETYIIEPQSGDIYILPTPSSPLQRFPFTMSELVDMSPFNFAAADDHRVFVGRKETLLLVVELETGNIKTTIDSACPWDPLDIPDTLSLNLNDSDQVDLGERDGSKPKSSRPTEVLVGRTDYHVTIHTRPSSKHRIPVQNLSFSTYGPNNQDNVLQASYRSTKDDAYIQSLPNGEIISFKARGEGSDIEDPSVLWGYKFKNPIVAIFDVFRNPAQHPPNTFVLLQPRPQLAAILPNLARTTLMDQLPQLDSVYVGMVEETGSLFAMSPDRFPLVVFSDGRKNRVKIMDAPGDEEQLPSEVDAITAERKRREKAMKERQYGSEDDRCLNRASLYIDRRCPIGIRQLEGGDGDGPEMRLKRLIDGVPGVPTQVSTPWEPPENAQKVLNQVKITDAPGDEEQLPSEVDAITAERKRREKAMKERQCGSEDDRCLDRSSLYTDRRCLVGIHQLEGGDGDSPDMRLKRLLDGMPGVQSPVPI
ncbi:hypothetical protein MVEN_01779100 [Mycena venus]|uniref:ER membrane protein complex subunit 1 n=1 Tax=Mycena venus TaxID=2733690 RepID=A0A8H6XLI0_9AGAR|nr:hypothetical protein MVEN_01779100 [Mycena venus]